jgi:hypothetical protein
MTVLFATLRQRQRDGDDTERGIDTQHRPWASDRIFSTACKQI